MSTLTVGQVVSVPWGLDVLEGTVLRVFDTGVGPRVVVQVHVPGTGDAGEGDETTLTLPIDAVEPINNLSDRPQPGSWVTARSYERRVADAISRTITRIADPAEISESIPDHGIDLLIESPGFSIAVEVKYVASRSRLPEREVDRALETASRTLLPLLLVTNANLAPGALRAFLARKDIPQRFGLVRWRSPEDDADLESELRLLLSKTS
jgi:hypothetical protein